MRRLVKAMNESGHEDMDAHSRLMDKTLTEFPIFALNDDYLKAFSLILQDKMDQVKGIIEEQVWEAGSPEHLFEEQQELNAPHGSQLMGQHDQLDRSR